jgi:hypothetical protein
MPISLLLLVVVEVVATVVAAVALEAIVSFPHNLLL